MLQREDGPHGVLILRVNAVLHGVLGIVGIVTGDNFFRAGRAVQIHALTLAAVQIDGGEHTEAGAEDSRHLHVPLGVGQLPAHPVVHVLNGQNRKMPGLGVVAEMGGDGDIAVVLPAGVPLTQELALLPSGGPGLTEALQGENLLKFRLIGLVQAVLDVNAHQLGPGERGGRQVLPHAPVHLNRRGGAVVHIHGINIEILLAQAANQLLIPGVDPLALQTLPEYVVNVLDAEHHKPFAGGARVGQDLHHVPPPPAVDQTAVKQGHQPLLPAGGLTQVLQMDEGGKAVRVLRVNGPAVGEALHLNRHGARLRAPAVRVGFQLVVGVPLQVDVHDFSIGKSAVVQAGGHRHHKGGHLPLPQNAGGGQVHHAAVSLVVADGGALLPALDGQQRAAAARACPCLVARPAQGGAVRHLLGPFIHIEKSMV